VADRIGLQAFEQVGCLEQVQGAVAVGWASRGSTRTCLGRGE
jgi:hypothetical protein